MTRLSTTATLTLAAISSDRSQFADRIRQAANAGSDNPVFESAKKYPAEYNAWRKNSETQLAARSRFGSIAPNSVDGSDVSRAVLFRVGDPYPSGQDGNIDRGSLNKLAASLQDEGTVKIFVGDDSVVANIVGSASNFRIADSQLVADLSFVTSHPKTQAILQAIERDPASVQFSMTDDEDALVVAILTGEKLAASGERLLKFAMSNTGDYNHARKTGAIR